MNALTTAERQRLIAAGFRFEFPPTTPKRTTRTPVRKSKPKPDSFSGTPQERARHAVKLARTGKHSLCAIATACGYHPSSSVAIRELVAGHGRLIEVARQGEVTGRLGFAHGLNRAAIRIVRDFYGMPNINGRSEGNEDLRGILRGLSPAKLAEVAELAGLNSDSLSPFLRGRYGMTQATQRRVRDAIAELGLKGGAL